MTPQPFAPPLDVAGLAARLVAIPSISNDEGDVVAFLESLLTERAWRTTRIPVTPGRDALLATWTDAAPVTLSTHLDTVPPFIPPTRRDGRLHGRGACDAKGIAAAMVCAAERLRERGVAVALLFVVGEEVTHDGAHAADGWAKAHGFRSRALVNGEPTESTLALGTKGAIRVVVRTKGVAAHSAYPHLGHSATRDLVNLLAEIDALPLPEDELLGATTVNIGALSGGVADNVLAPAAEARLMIRLVTPPEEIVRLVERWVGDRATLDWGAVVPPVRLGVLPGLPTSVAAFATDIPALPSWGTPYLFGPGSIHVAHTADEWIDLEELEAAVATYERIVSGISNG